MADKCGVGKDRPVALAQQRLSPKRIPIYVALLVFAILAALLARAYPALSVVMAAAVLLCNLGVCFHFSRNDWREDITRVLSARGSKIWQEAPRWLWAGHLAGLLLGPLLMFHAAGGTMDRDVFAEDPGFLYLAGLTWVALTVISGGTTIVFVSLARANPRLAPAELRVAFLGMAISALAAWWSLDWLMQWCPPPADAMWLASWGAWGLPLGICALGTLGSGYRHLLLTGWQHRINAEGLRADAAEQARRLAEGQLALMQAQVEPHFLYNTLASVQYLVRKDAAAADFLLTQLIRYLRHAMPKMRSPMSTLGQEFELADAYLQIARMRMGGRLSVEVELPQYLHAVDLPPLVLQTLVENAIQHGVEPKIGPVAIDIRASWLNGELRIQVQDNGVGLGRAPTAGSGTGLAGIRLRLASIYGPRAQLEVHDRPEGGVRAQLLLREVALPKPTY